jgi:MFS family permease
MHSLVRRVPMALGPVLGGILIGAFGKEDGVRLAFLVAFILGGVSLVLQQLLIAEGERPKREVEGNPLRALSLMSPSLRSLLTSDILVRFCEQIPYAFVVVWAINVNGITPIQFGILTTVEMVTAMLIYIPVAYLADRGQKKPFVVATFGFFTLFPLVLLFTRSFWPMVLAFIVRGLKEFGEPTRKALIMDLAPEGKKAGTFGAYYLARDVVVSAAAFGGAFLWDLSPAANLMAAFGFGLLGTVTFALFGKDLQPVENGP